MAEGDAKEEQENSGEVTAEEPSGSDSANGKMVEGNHSASVPVQGSMIPTGSDISDEAFDPPAVDSKPTYELDRILQ